MVSLPAVGFTFHLGLSLPTCSLSVIYNLLVRKTRPIDHPVPRSDIIWYSVISRLSRPLVESQSDQQSVFLPEPPQDLPLCPTCLSILSPCWRAAPLTETKRACDSLISTCRGKERRSM
ncbi:hypothetical protein B0H65DRAFT_463135, partial [Neurospora tetraspora]